jgi:hypothetical protein
MFPTTLAHLAARRRSDGAQAWPLPAAEVTIRIAREADGPAVHRLAQLDSRPVPEGDVLVAEVSGELRAALPLGGGEPIGDPFRPTAALTALLADYSTRVRHA